jgi:hypothetical protein
MESTKSRTAGARTAIVRRGVGGRILDAEAANRAALLDSRGCKLDD